MATVNFSIPTIPSLKSTTPDKSPILFIPDIEYLVKFAEGDIGISDNIRKSTILKNIAKTTNIFQLETFAKISGAKFSKPLESYIKDGKVQINPNDLTIEPVSGDLGGIKPLEKALLQSIFETQKPYIEVIKLVTENLTKIEDIIARVLAVSGSSMKPSNNPKAMGYKGSNDLLKGLSKLNSLSKKTKSDTNNANKNKPQDITNGNIPSGYTIENEFITYSTGRFNPNVNYTFVYRYEKDDKINLPDEIPVEVIENTTEPDVIVFGIYDSEWNYLSDDKIDKDVNWLKRTGKWFGKFNQIKPDVDFQYVKNNNGDIVNYGDEGPSVKVEKDTTFIKKGFPKIKSLNELTNYYRNYYLEETKLKLDSKKELSQSVKDNTLLEISNILNKTDNAGISSIQTTVEGSLRHGFLPSTIIDNTPGLNIDKFNSVKYPFKPNKINIVGNQKWIDPESQYDMKIIKCDSSRDINYYDVISKSNKSTKIIRFIKSTLIIKLSNNDNFHYILTGPSGDLPSIGNVTEFLFDNHDTSFAYNINLQYYKVPDEYKNGKTWTEGLYTYTFLNNNGKYTINKTYYGTGDYSEVDVVKFPNGKRLYFNANGEFLYTELYSGSLSSFLPKNLEKNDIVIDILNYNFNQNRTIIQPNQIRVSNDEIISSSQILNEHLVTNQPYSKGVYGSPIGKTQNIEQIYRYMMSENDTETYYIVEGRLSTKNTNSAAGGSNNGNSGGNDYQIKDVIGAIKVFIELMIDVYTKLVPTISDLITLIKNPSKFVTDIIIAKLGDNFGTENEKFGFFSKEFLDDIKKLSEINTTSRNGVIEAKDFIENSRLKNYVYIGNGGNIKFILDGMATVGLFGEAPIFKSVPGVRFGIETKIGTLASQNPEIPFNLIFNSSKKTISNSDSSSLKTRSSTNSNSDTTNLQGKNATKETLSDEIKTQLGDNVNYDDVTIQYSTGTFDKDVEYTYIYVNDYIQKILSEAIEFEEQGDLGKAINKLEEAYKLYPNDTAISNKIDELSKISSFLGSHPILDFMLNIVTLPLKVVFGIITYILDFFKSLVDPFELPIKIIDFVSFKWMLDFFNPSSKNSMFAMAGILFDIPTFLTIWLPGLESGLMNKFDLNKIVKLPWVKKLPVYNREQFKTLIYGTLGSKAPRMIPIMMISSILNLIEGIMNGFIDFIWGLLGLPALIKPPYIRLSRDTNGDLSPKDIMDLLNGKYFEKDVNNYVGSFTGASSSNSDNTSFVYNVKTSDGRDLKELNQIELDKWMEDNKDLQFIFTV
jgi:hypothetical protein